MIIELYSNDNQQTNNFASDYLKKNHFGKIISLDVGKKRIGIAVCDENRLICTPKLIINRFINALLNIYTLMCVLYFKICFI